MDKGYDYANQRLMQFIELLNWIAKEVPRQDAFVLGGDFNFGPNGTFHERLWDDMHDLLDWFNLPEFRQASFDKKTAYTTEPAEGKIDHLFATPPLKAIAGKAVMTEKREIVKGEGPVRLSDHLGWETVFSF